MNEVMRYDLDTGDVETMAFMSPASAGDYVEFSDFDRVTAERDALQLRLNAADQRNDDLSGMLQHLVDNPYRFTDAYRARISAALNPEIAPTIATEARPFTEQFIEDHLGKKPERIKGMIETIGGEFAIMIDTENGHFGWTFKRHPDGMWVSGRKATDAEMHAARTQARLTNQQ